MPQHSDIVNEETHGARSRTADWRSHSRTDGIDHPMSLASPVVLQQRLVLASDSPPLAFRLDLSVIMHIDCIIAMHVGKV